MRRVLHHPVTGLVFAGLTLAAYLVTRDLYTLLGVFVWLVAAYVMYWTRAWDRRHGVR